MIEHDVFNTRLTMLDTIKNNPGVIIIKFGAEWCGPCKTVDPSIKANMKMMPADKIRTIMIDVDNAFDAYAFLKSKKFVIGIPACLAYYQGNNSYVPDDVVIGADPKEINMFFKTCLEQVQ